MPIGDGALNLDLGEALTTRMDDLFNFVPDPATLIVAFDRVAGNTGVPKHRAWTASPSPSRRGDSSPRVLGVALAGSSAGQVIRFLRGYCLARNTWSARGWSSRWVQICCMISGGRPRPPSELTPAPTPAANKLVIDTGRPCEEIANLALDCRRRFLHDSIAEASGPNTIALWASISTPPRTGARSRSRPSPASAPVSASATPSGAGSLPTL
jgi:hypothetical protein